MFSKLNPAIAVLVLGCAALLPLTLASTKPPLYTILVPCGESSDNKHAVVPDASGCQRISNIGAFTIAAFGTFDKGVRLGFSSTPDCAKTYAPPTEEMVELQQNQICRSFVVGADANGIVRGQDGPESGSKALQATKRDGMQKREEGEGEENLFKRASEVGGFFRKRSDEKETGEGHNPNTEPTQPNGANTAGVTLSYVMLVNA
ncbi:uncharacterized protein SPSC_04342 [Sporisorium scitamineum]|uniref:Uncharacterized protein n=1 Tax=Sporisorium scitamineum TaxID=49012 RepID=A0A0F7RST9_9BASI|nr:uncharacterized protein SPSC_04342 [Sporisorium scitamineum]CDR99295.1 hypothetical protein [Sporisorium scitamineum]